MGKAPGAQAVAKGYHRAFPFGQCGQRGAQLIAVKEVVNAVCRIAGIRAQDIHKGYFVALFVRAYGLLKGNIVFAPFGGAQMHEDLIFYAS